jgi:hypothetical protein
MWRWVNNFLLAIEIRKKTYIQLIARFFKAALNFIEPVSLSQ